jgi:hypothetical protein
MMNKKKVELEIEELNHINENILDLQEKIKEFSFLLQKVQNEFQQKVQPKLVKYHIEEEKKERVFKEDLLQSNKLLGGRGRFHKFTEKKIQ